MTDKQIKPEGDSQTQKKRRQAEKHRLREVQRERREVQRERWKRTERQMGDRDLDSWRDTDATEKEKRGKRKGIG